MHRETKWTAISPEVKEAVFRRDGRCCILCGSPAGLPNAHVVRRSAGGMGVEQNVVTLCQECHRAFDEGANLERLGHGTTRESLYDYIVAYLKNFYPDWSRESVIYRRIDHEP
jgi:hypothetical protein